MSQMSNKQTPDSLFVISPTGHTIFLMLTEGDSLQVNNRGCCPPGCGRVVIEKVAGKQLTGSPGQDDLLSLLLNMADLRLIDLDISVTDAEIKHAGPYLDLGCEYLFALY